MIFASSIFLYYFLPVFLALYYMTPRAMRSLTLALSSYVFYGWWRPDFVVLMWISTVVDYACGRAIVRDREAGRGTRRWVVVSAVVNLGLLGYFKYVNFGLDTLLALGLGSESALAPFYMHTEIPLGISFYTFQTISYSVDVYRGRLAACRSPLDFALFVAFFPQLIAGPIMRASELLPQIRRAPRADARQTLDGIELCAVGLFKKVVLADGFAVLVDACFAEPARYAGAALLAATFAFSVQIYCDFSGYSTLARGLGKLLGYELPENFGYTLFARDPIEVRREWHKTLTAWFRDYVYRPLGGDGGSAARMALNTLLTWVLLGVWHGASWSFVVWGALNGLLLVVYRLGRSARWWPQRAVSPLLTVLLTRVSVILSLVLFRAPDLPSAGTIFARIFTLAPGEPVHWGWALGIAGVIALHALSYRYYAEDLLSRVGGLGKALILGAVLLVLYLFAGSGDPFYYFQF